MNIIIPLGGKGERFVNHGYIKPKPLINIFEKCMIDYVIDNLYISNNDKVFIIYNKNLNNYDFNQYINTKFPFINLIKINDTKGASDTLYLGIKDILNNYEYNKKTIILDCDTFYTEDILNIFNNIDENVVFYRKNYDELPIYSYIELDNENNIINIKEKRKISDNANTGAYAFTDINILYEYCKYVFDNNITCNNEPSSFESEDSKSRMLLNNLPSGKIVNEPYPAKLDKLNSSSMMMNEPGTENLLELTKDEIKEIFNKDITCILSYIEKVNFNDRLKTNHSFCTTNLGGAYLSVFDTNNSKIKQNRKKFFFDEIINIAVSKIEELYKLYKSYFTIEKQNNIETTLIKINELKNMDMNKRIYKEMLKQLNILSYNDKNIVENTWNNKNIKGMIPETFEEDIEMYLTDNSESD